MRGSLTPVILALSLGLIATAATIVVIIGNQSSWRSQTSSDMVSWGLVLTLMLISLIMQIAGYEARSRQVNQPWPGLIISGAISEKFSQRNYQPRPRTYAVNKFWEEIHKANLASAPRYIALMRAQLAGMALAVTFLMTIGSTSLALFVPVLIISTICM